MMNDDLIPRLQLLAGLLGDPRPRATVRDAIAEIERLRDELLLCCELKRTYQEQAAAERERWVALCDAERSEFAEQAANNNGSRESDFAFGSVCSAERIKAAGIGA